MSRRSRSRRNPDVSLTTLLAVGAAAVGGYFLIVKPMLASVRRSKAAMTPKLYAPVGKAMQPMDMMV